MAFLGYYIFVLPLSYLPLFILYGITRFLYLILRFVFPYRKEVITNNLKQSFPNKSEQEINSLRNKFYLHFTEILAEGIKNLSISKNSLQKRFRIENPELMQELYNKGKNVLLVSGHYNNWEWMITSQNFLFPHQAYGIGMPLTSKFWDKKVNQRRERFGMRVIHAKNYKEALTADPNELKSVLVLSDQSPGDSLKSYWMDFLKQPTAILFGAELMAHELNYAVVFYTPKKVKRGYYSARLELITDDPRKMKWGEITEAHAKRLEKSILECPESWLWSHKRWKREIPTNLKELKSQQREKFNTRFNY